MVGRCTFSKIVQAHHVAVGGGGRHEVSGGVHLDVGVLRLPHRFSAHGIEELVKGGRLRGQMQNFKGGELAAQFPPQRCGPGPPPKEGVAGGLRRSMWITSGEGSRDAAQPTTSSIPSAPDWYAPFSN